MWIADRFDQPIDLSIDQAIDRFLTVGWSGQRNLKIISEVTGKTEEECQRFSDKDDLEGLTVDIGELIGSFY